MPPTAAVRGSRSALSFLEEEAARREPLNATECARLVALASKGDDRAMERVVAAHIGMCLSLAARAVRPGVPVEDLVCEAMQAVWRAVGTYDPARGYAFGGFAYFRIRAALSAAATRLGSTVRVPHRRRQMIRKRAQTERGLAQELMRRPTESEIASRMGVDLEELQDLGTASPVQSLDAPITAGERGPSRLDVWLAAPGDPPQERDAEEARAERLRRALDTLPLGAARVLRLAHGLEGGRAHSLGEIASILGRNPEWVRRQRDAGLQWLSTTIAAVSSAAGE
jgi:RNA polymerase sigma factor (sigma-70 family)